LSDGDSVYWTMGSGDIRRVSVNGGGVEQVATSVSPSRLALDAQSAYWATSTGEIRRAPKTGGEAELLVANANGLGALQVDDASLFWLVNPDEGASAGQVLKAPKSAGANPAALLTMSSLDPGTLSLVGSTLYYFDPLPGTSQGGVRELDSKGGMPITDVIGSFHLVASGPSTVCSAGPDPRALATDPLATAQAITCAALDGSNAHVVAGALSVVTSIALDDATVYFATVDGSLTALPVDHVSPTAGASTSDGENGGSTVPAGACYGGAGCSCSGGAGGVQVCDASGSGTCQCPGATVFATGPAGGATVAIDDTNVYWAHVNGEAIFVLPR
jgi:hypothetical protein